MEVCSARLHFFNLVIDTDRQRSFGVSIFGTDIQEYVGRSRYKWHVFGWQLSNCGFYIKKKIQNF